jgi:hypothetical protein
MTIALNGTIVPAHDKEGGGPLHLRGSSGSMTTANTSRQ